MRIKKHTPVSFNILNQNIISIYQFFFYNFIHNFRINDFMRFGTLPKGSLLSSLPKQVFLFDHWIISVQQKVLQNYLRDKLLTI